MDTVDSCWCRPLCDCFHLGIVHLDAITVDDHSKIFNFSLVERALLWSCEEIVVTELLEYFLHLGLVLRQVTLGEYHDVVNVDNNHILHVCENLIHHHLECGGGVAKSKEHDSGFEGSVMAYECGLPFVSFLDMDVVISPLEINLHEVLRSLEPVDELGNEWERVVVLNCVLVQIPVVLHHPFLAVLLWYEEYRGGCLDLDKQIYPLASCSSMNSEISFCSSTERGISQPFFGLNVSFKSMA